MINAEDKGVCSEAQTGFDQTRPPEQATANAGKTPKDNAFIRFWNKLDVYLKIAAVAIAVLIVFLIVAVFAKKAFAIVISVLEIAGIIIAILMHKDVIKVSQKWIKYLVMGVSVLLIVLNIASFSWGKSNSTTADIPETSGRTVEENEAPTATKAPTVTPAPKPTKTPAPEITAKPAVQDCRLYLEIDFEANLFFSTYNVEVYLDDQYVATMPHGKYFTALVDTKTGNHKLTFKEENGSNRETVDLDVKTDSTFTCKIKCYSSSIDVSNEYLSGSIRNLTITMPDTVGMLYSEALTELKKAGFINISYTTVGNHSIWDDDNWLVQSQSVKANTEVAKSESVTLTCISLGDYFKNEYKGKNVEEIQKLAEAGGFSIRFEDQSGSSMNDSIGSMDAATKKKWIATDARQYGGAVRTAVVTIDSTSANTPRPTSKATAKATAAPKQDKVSYESFCKIKMKSSLDEVTKTMGGKGELSDSSEIMGDKMETYTWYADTFSFVSVSFTNGKVDGKLQFGLNGKTKAVTLNQFDQVSSGMTYEQVKKIMGEGYITSEHYILGSTMTTYEWDGNDLFSTASVTFDNGKVSSKYQTGLS